MGGSVQAHQQITLWDGEQQLDKHAQDVVKGRVTVQMKHAEIDVVATQRCPQHGEADGDTLQCTTQLRIQMRHCLVLIMSHKRPPDDHGNLVNIG